MFNQFCNAIKRSAFFVHIQQKNYITYFNLYCIFPKNETGKYKISISNKLEKLENSCYKYSYILISKNNTFFNFQLAKSFFS